MKLKQYLSLFLVLSFLLSYTTVFAYDKCIICDSSLSPGAEQSSGYCSSHNSAGYYEGACKDCGGERTMDDRKLGSLQCSSCRAGNGGSDNSNNEDSGGTDGSWVKVLIKQGGVERGVGCTVCTFQMMVQNSGTLTKYQLPDGVTDSRTDAYNEFDKACEGKLCIGVKGGKNYNSWKRDGFFKFTDEYCSGTFKKAELGDYKEESSYTTNDLLCITGVGDKDFHSMGNEELITAMKMIYNQGFWATFCVSYVGNQEGNNGPKGYGANHATMFAGVDNNGIYVADPATGTVFNYFDSKTHRGGTEYKLEYMLIVKNTTNSPLSLSGGNPANASQSDAEALGLSQGVVNGTILLKEEELSSYLRLTEANVELLLENATRDGLTQNQLESLSDWENNIAMDKEESGWISLLRKCVMLVGILFTVWMLLIYISYWFDRLNNFIDLDLLGVLSFGFLHISDTEEECTFHLKDLGQEKSNGRTVNHRAILSIVFVGLGFGVLLISGVFYIMVANLVNFVRNFLN